MIAQVRRATSPASLAAIAVAVFVAVLLGEPAILSVAQGRLPETSASVPTVLPSYREQVDAMLTRYDVLAVSAGALLAERDANPMLVHDAGWLGQHEAVVRDLQELYQSAEALRPPSELASVQACLTDGLRLAATGQSLLQEGFESDGHGAYYFGSHGNWDLNLAANRLRECRMSLASP